MSAVGGEGGGLSQPGKGDIKNMSLSFSLFFVVFFFTSFKTNDKKRDWIFLYIRNKNDHQMESGRMWRGGGGGVRGAKWFIV